MNEAEFAKIVTLALSEHQGVFCLFAFITERCLL